MANWQKFFDSPTVGMLGHTWSLSIEEQFYALWPPPSPAYGWVRID